MKAKLTTTEVYDSVLALCSRAPSDLFSSFGRSRGTLDR